MRRRTLAQAAMASAASLALPGGALARRGTRQFTQATPAASPAASPVSSASALTFGEVRSFPVDGQPVAMSPDGKWLAGPGVDGTFCIWDIETLEAIVATSKTPLNVHAETVTWAPDSSAVAFSLNAAVMLIDSDIFVMDLDGTLHDLTDDSYDDALSLSGDGPEVPVDIYPAWSPDSSQLLFARSLWGGKPGGTVLTAIDRDGGGLVDRFTVDETEPLVVYSPMHWLDDGSAIFSVLHADFGNDQNGVWRLTPDGEAERILAGNEDAELPTPFVNDVSSDGTQATVVSVARANQYTTGPELVFCVLDLGSGTIAPIQTTDPSYSAIVRIATPGTFTPDGASLLSLEREGDRGRIVQSDLGGNVLAATDLPDGTRGPSTQRGLSVAENSTLFMPTVLDGEQRRYGGIIIPFH